MGFVANYMANLARIAGGKQPLRPLLFSYYLTHRCALSCRYCCDGAGKPFKETPVPELSTADAQALISELRRYSDTLDITGGEPMVRTDLEEILEHAQREGFRVVLNTKGVGLPERPELARLSDVLVLSVDSLNPERLTGLVGRANAANDVLRSLEWLLARRGELKTRIVLSAVATPDTLDDVSEVLACARKHDLGFALSPEIVGTKVHPGLLDNPRYESLIDEAIATKAAGTQVLGVTRYLRGIRDFDAFRCHPLLMPTIRPDGRMNYPCIEVVQETFDLRPRRAFEHALASLDARGVPLPSCEGQCHIFCHMALSLLQRDPVAALAELKRWS